MKIFLCKILIYLAWLEFLPVSVISVLFFSSAESVKGKYSPMWSVKKKTLMRKQRSLNPDQKTSELSCQRQSSWLCSTFFIPRTSVFLNILQLHPHCRAPSPYPDTILTLFRSGPKYGIFCFLVFVIYSLTNITQALKHCPLYSPFL